MGWLWDKCVRFYGLCEQIAKTLGALKVMGVIIGGVLLVLAAIALVAALLIGYAVESLGLLKLILFALAAVLAVAGAAFIAVGLTTRHVSETAQVNGDHPPVKTTKATPLKRASLEEIGELGARYAKTSKAIYAFLNKNAARTDESKVIAEYLHKFDARVMGLYSDLIAAGLSSSEQLEAGMRPVTSVRDIQHIARALATNGESYSAERLATNQARAMGELTKEDLPHKSSCPLRPRVETFVTARSDGIEVETTRCLECGASADRFVIPPELLAYLEEWRTSYRDMPSHLALERWMDEKRLSESKRRQLRERSETFMAAIMEDAP